MLSIICNYFPLGVAVSASLIRKAKAQECQETLGARHLPLHQAGCRQWKPALGPILTDRVLQCRRHRHPLESRRRGALPPAFKDSSAPWSRPPLARGSGPEPRTHHRSSPRSPPPPWPRRAPGRRQVQTSPGLRGGGEGHRRRGLRSAQQWAARPRPAPPRRGHSGSGARLQGAESQHWGSRGCGGARQPRLPAAGAAREGRAGSPLATR